MAAVVTSVTRFVTLSAFFVTFCIAVLLLSSNQAVAKQVVEIDLRSGIVKGYSNYVTFLVPPKPSHSRRCDVQAVLRLDFSDVYKVAKFQFEYDRPRLWTLDITDSPYGDGYGGDNGTTSNMAETQIFNRQMRIYGNSLLGIQDASIDGGLLLKVVDDLVKKGKTQAMEISDEKIEWYEGDTKQFIESKFLYTLNGQNTTYGNVEYDVYIGLNRVVGADYRTGDGLCKATITLVKGPVDACATGQNNCDEDAFCFNTRRSYRCRCKHGFYGNGEICIDEDECEYENGGCVHSCTNMEGNFTCSCRQGFVLDRDGFNCIDVNECFINRGGCAHQCTNTLGSYECKCNAGYSLNADGRTCSRGTVCSEKLGCGQHCVSVSRGLGCACRSGYKLHPNGRDCIQTCAVGNGGCQHKCADGRDGAVCTCHDKYKLSEDGRTCLPTCGVQNGGCERRCKDTPTGPKCSCPPGYLLHQDEKTCIDIDECSRLDPGCSHGCINTHGSFECICPKGYKVQDDQRTCMDVDECSLNTTCEQTCVNTPGSFECLCRDGYQLYGITHCADKDECSANNGDCDHLCKNMLGNFQCQCRPGYKLHDNGKDCVENSCNSLRPPVKASLSCRRHGNDEVCVVTCNGKAIFTSYSQPEFRTTCGPSTQYQWSHERDNRTMPSCSEQVSAPKLKRKAKFVFFANQCTMKRRSKQDFQEFLHKVLTDMFYAKKKLRCAQLCRIENINLVCGSQRTKFRHIARRTGKEIVRAEFDLHISPQEVSNKCDVECVRDRTARRLKRTLKILRKAINKSQFYVSFEGHSYGVPRKSLKASRAEEACPVGKVLVEKNCVSCSIGTYYDLQKETCLPCSAGNFQDREGQVLCKPCPHGRTGVGMMGARNVSQCEGQCNPGWYSGDGHRPCTRCHVGTYQPDHGRTSCKPCGNGITTSGRGASSFSQCAVKEKCGSGSYYNRTHRACEVCPLDTYQPDTGQDYCIRCPGETRTDYPGATDSIMCKDRSCGGHIGQFQGYIQTPNWPGDYPRDVQCTWSITPEKGRRILVVIPEIFLASQDKCGDILVMRKSESPYSLTSYETCESTETPIAFTARSRKLWIQFRTNSKHAAAGFSIPYVTYNEEYQDLIDDIVRDGRLYSSHQHQEVLKDRKLLDALLEVIAQPYNYFKYANVSRSMFPESFIRLLTPKVRRFFT